MRLLTVADGDDFSLTKPLEHPPPYAILSHTWGPDEDEITFDDFSTGQYKSKAGFAKFQFCAQQARKDGIDHFWIDTCCIKKSDASELSESITSMFRWYRNAKKCYVYLADVPDLKRRHDGSKSRTEEAAFGNSRWFTRGWTLQELIAPRHVEFYTRDWKPLGTKQALAVKIHERTGIPSSAMLGQQELSEFGIQERISWARERRTRRPEDKCYCLLGILGVSMPSNYGEGEDALQRLTDALLRKYASQDVCGLDSFYHATSTSEQGTGAKITSQENLSAHDRRQMMCEYLKFDQMDARRSTIKREHASTCAWLLKHHIYTQWEDTESLQCDHGLLWIKGKPGSGKSTLMKFAHAKAARAPPNSKIVISFFFNARGDELEKSTNGMYRALLSQLLDKAPDLQPLLDEYTLVNITSANAIDWTEEQLCDLMREVISGLEGRQCMCFIDALDECDEHQVRNMVEFFEELGQSALENHVKLRICFASRHYPTIDTADCLKLIVENEQGHDDDLTKYIHKRLRAGTSKHLDSVRARLKQKANGVFMWVVLVVDILNKEFERGYLPAVEKRLKEIPAGLSDLFRDMLQRDNKHLDEFRLCLSWILFARRPLGKEEFYFAMVAGLDPDKLATLTPDDLESELMEKYVLSSSKGLAELTKSKKPTVQFIHESVRDFLVKDTGLRDIWSGSLHDLSDLESLCQDRLKRCCVTYIDTAVTSSWYHTLESDELPNAKSKEAKSLRQAVSARFPFLEYASQSVFYHAEEAANNVQQIDFLNNFTLKTWINAYDVFEIHSIRRYTPGASIQYVLADQNCPRLLRCCARQDDIWSDSNERYGSPMIAALFNSHIDCARALLQDCERSLLLQAVSELSAHRNFALRRKKTLYIWAASQGHEALARLLVIAGKLGGQADLLRDGLNAASIEGRTRVVQMLLDCGADVNMQGIGYGNALQAAARSGSVETVRLLLDRGADINAQGGSYSNVLQHAAWSGSVETVRLLLDRGADINAQGGSYDNVLQQAVYAATADMVRLLLDRCADINAQGALETACIRGLTEIVQLLLDNGADVNAQGGSFGDALRAAVLSGSVETVRLLLDRGADINAQGGSYGNVLQQAAYAATAEIVRLLLDRGADVNAQGALETACSMGRTETVQLLLDNGADVDLEGAIRTAAEDYHPAIVEMLHAKVEQLRQKHA